MSSAAETAGKFRSSDGCELAYTLRRPRHDGAPRVALIHSLGFDQSMWRDVISHLADQAETLTYDCRGHGKSARGGSVYTIERFADDLAELLEEVDWPHAAIAGCSMGGCVAQAFAARHAEKMSALALIDTTAYYGDRAPAQWRERAENARAKGLAAMAEFQLSRWFSDRFRRENPEWMHIAASVLAGNDAEGYAAACLMLGGIDFRPLLARIAVPTAIIAGQDDYATPVAMSLQLHEAIRDSTLTLIPEARHLTPIERPDVVAGQIGRLFERARA